MSGRSYHWASLLSLVAGPSLASKSSVLEVAECDHDPGDVVEGAPQQAVLNQIIDAEARQLVDGGGLWVVLSHVSHSVPDYLDALPV